MELIAAALVLAAFLALYAILHRRAARAGRQPSIRWGWLAAIVGLAAVALMIGALAH
jgi:hypothetical protein